VYRGELCANWKLRVEPRLFGLDDAVAGHVQLVVLTGEPGIGKTSTAEQLAARAHGVAVLWGRCWEQEGAPAFWPAVQVLRAAAQRRAPSTLGRQMVGSISYIAHLVPEMQCWVPDIEAPPDLESGAARFRLFDAIATFLKDVANQMPLLLILDDLHWADQASLLLLHFLASQLREARLLVLGLYRDVDVAADHPLALAFSSLIAAGQCLEMRGLA